MATEISQNNLQRDYQTMTLDDIARDFNTDKVSGLHDFLRLYERRLGHLRNEPITLIEIGVLNGGSVRTWSKYFPNAKIVGLDISDECKQFEAGNISIRIGDATDLNFLFEVIREFGRPHVFIDDGSHRWDHQISTLKCAFPLLLEGGYYIMEDIDTSFAEHMQKAPFDGLSEISAMEYLYKLSRVVVGERALLDEKPYDMFMEKWAGWIGSVELGRRTSVISKKTAFGGGPT